MKKHLIFPILVFLILISSGNAKAVIFLDVNPDMNVWLNRGETHTWHFDLDNDTLAIGDVNPGDFIYKSKVVLDIFDDEWDFLRTEYSLIRTDGWPRYMGEIDTGKYKFGTTLLTFDHRLNLSVKSLYGDFGVHSVMAGGKYYDNTPDSVPEPFTTTMLILSGGYLGLFGWRRRSKNISHHSND